MQQSLMPSWMQSVAEVNPVNWAVQAGREASLGGTDWSMVAGRIGLLAVLLAACSAFATRAFRSYQRSGVKTGQTPFFLQLRRGARRQHPHVDLGRNLGRMAEELLRRPARCGRRRCGRRSSGRACPSGWGSRRAGAAGRAPRRLSPGLRWPSGRRGPQPQIGSSARSRPPSPISRMPANRSVSPAKKTVLAAGNVVAEARRRRPERQPVALVFGVGGGHRHGADPQVGALVDLDHLPESLAPQQRPGSAGDDYRHLLTQLRQRGRIEVIHVRVRDQHRVDAAQRVRRHRPAAAQMGDAAAEDGVGQQPHPVHVDQHRRVADVGDPHRPQPRAVAYAEASAFSSGFAGSTRRHTARPTRNAIPARIASGSTRPAPAITVVTTSSE